MPGHSKLQIKINALTRLVKEYDLYVEEEADFKRKVSELEEHTASDKYELKRAKQVLEETQRVLNRVRQSLKDYVTEVRRLGGLKPEEEKQANQAVEDATSRLK